MKYAVIAEKLVKTYNGVKALNDVNLMVRSGRIYCLLGPNGAGKSTLISVIVGITKPDKGKIVVLGGSPDTPRIRARIGFQPQEHGLHPNLTGWENLLFYAGVYGVSPRDARIRIRELAERLGITDYLGRPVRTYSGGLRQRLSIVAALIHDPELIVLDEPTTGLDPSVRKKVWGLIEDLRRSGKTIVLATHYMEEAEKLGDEVAIMDRGRVVVSGPPEELKKEYGAPAVIEVIMREAGMAGKLEIYLVEHAGLDTNRTGPETLRIYCRDPDQLIPEITSIAYKLGLSISGLRALKPGLEDVFLKLTGRRLGE